jgi:hypothetical protein
LRRRAIKYHDATPGDDAIRAELADDARAAKPYRMKPRDLGLRGDIDLTKALGLAAELEDVELDRKLEYLR